MTKRTKKITVAAIILTLVSFALCFGPAFFYVGAGLLGGAATVQKVGLIFTCFFSIIISFICFIRKTVFKSSVWLLAIGLWLCLDNIIGMIIITAVCQTVDELIIAPLASHFRSKAHINREIDKRNIP